MADGLVILSSILGFAVVVLLITALWLNRRRSQLSRQLEQARMGAVEHRLLVQNAAEGIAVVVDDHLALVNPKGRKILELEESDLRSLRLTEMIHPEDREPVLTAYERVMMGDGNQPDIQFRLITPAGNTRSLLVHSVKLDWGGQPAALCMFTDITELKKVERVLAESEERFRLLYEDAPLPYQSLDVDGTILEVNAAWLELLGYSRDEVIGKSFFDLLDDDRGYIKELFADFLQRGKVSDLIFSIKHRDGSLVTVMLYGKVGHDTNGDFKQTHGILRDISEMHKTEEALRQSEEKFATAFRTSPDAVVINRFPDGAYLEVNEGFTRLTGYTPEEVLGKTDTEISIWGNREIEKLVSRLLREKGEVKDLEATFCTKDGRLLTGLLAARVIIINGQNCILSVTRDITARKKADEQLRRQLQHLSALRAIDMAISGSIDLNLTLQVLLDHVVSQLDVDAAILLLYNPRSQRLEYRADRGLRDPQVTRKASLRIGQSYAGTAALERRIVHCTNLANDEHSLLYSSSLVAEGFVAYYGVPLITKGGVKGVLEVLHRSSLSPDDTWLDFLDNFAGQAAIAIDNAVLFDEAQRINTDLIRAYDATIEGWAKALEMRDGETEGHSQRVTQMTIELAIEMGVSGEDIVHIRRGSLLHDIGKMGIPDSILLKPGKLTDEEWDMMRKHAEYAFQMLSPIEFLRPAVNIAYSHHERWDGSGYPRGLVGEQIPLEARVFSVIDVFDALISDRPYRKAWQREAAVEYIQQQAGKQFDPAVVEVFLRKLSDWAIYF